MPGGSQIEIGFRQLLSFHHLFAINGIFQAPKGKNEWEETGTEEVKRRSSYGFEPKLKSSTWYGSIFRQNCYGQPWNRPGPVTGACHPPYTLRRLSSKPQNRQRSGQVYAGLCSTSSSHRSVLAPRVWSVSRVKTADYPLR